MANVLDLRRRIRSVKNTRQITKAMKMVSAAKLRRAQERAMLARPYARMISNVLESLVRRTGDSLEVMHPLLVEREEKNVLVIVVAGDKGFAGAFNSNIAKAAQGFINGSHAAGQNVDIEPVGRKARDTFRKRYPAAVYEKKEEHYDNDLATHFEIIRHRAQPIEVTGDHPTILLKIGIDEVSDMAHDIIERYTRAEIDSVYVVYNEFKSVISQRVVIEKLLPIRKLGSHEITVAEEMTEEQKEAAGLAAKTAGTAEVDYLFDQSPERLFRHLMPKYVTTQIFHAMLESVAAEHAARMTAMDSATNNAGDMIDALSLTMNRVRQAAITKEIIEIVSGAAAL